MHFKMSSAICFNLDQSKMLSSGNGLLKYMYEGSVLGIDYPIHDVLI